MSDDIFTSYIASRIEREAVQKTKRSALGFILMSLLSLVMTVSLLWSTSVEETMLKTVMSGVFIILLFMGVVLSLIEFIKDHRFEKKIVEYNDNFRE